MIEQLANGWALVGLDSIPLIALCIFAGVARTLIQESKRSNKTFLTNIFLSVFVGVMSSGVAKHYHVSADSAWVLCMVAAFLADDILAVLLAAGTKLRQNPFDFLKALLELLTKK